MSLKTMSPHYRNKMDFVERHLQGLGPGAKVLDLGCGFGEYLNLCRGLGLEAYGLDLDGYALKSQRGVVLANGEEIPFKSKSFDIVICIDMLEHVQDDRRVIREVKRVLKKDGVFILSVPSYFFPFTYDPINAFLRPFGRKIRIGMWSWGHKRLYSRQSISKLLKGTNLEIVEFDSLTHLFISTFINYIPYIVVNCISLSYRKGVRMHVKKQGFLLKVMDKLNQIDKKYFSRTHGVGLCFVIKKR